MAKPQPADDRQVLEDRKQRARAWFESLQADIIARFEALEDLASPPLYKGPAGRFEKTPWIPKRGPSAYGSEDRAIRVSRLDFLLESLILAQDERWRRA